MRFKKTSSTVGNCVTIPSASLTNNSEDFTLYLIYSPLTLDDGVIIEKNNATSSTFPFSLELNSGFYKFSVKDSSNTISVMGSKQANANKPNLIRLSRAKGSQIEISINGVSSTQTDTLTSSSLNDAELVIGCRNGATPANFINGDIGETAFFNRSLSIKEIADIEEYFYKKWKMKKYEGALATQEFVACSVPSNINADTAVTTVQPTAGGQIGCKVGYNGAINYKCNGGSFSVMTNSCLASYCNVPNTLNTTADGSTATYTLSPLPLSYKSGYGGNVTYTCNGSGVFASSGSCSPNCTIPAGTNTTIDGSQVSFTLTSTPLTCASGYSGSPSYTCNSSGVISIVGSCVVSCSVSTSVVENFVGFSAQNPGVAVNLAAVIGSNVAVGTVGTYKFTAYAYQTWAGPYNQPWSLRYRCKANGTMDYDFQSGCNTGDYKTLIYFAERYINSLWCCTSPFLGTSTSSCSWSY